MELVALAVKSDWVGYSVFFMPKIDVALGFAAALSAILGLEIHSSCEEAFYPSWL